jgi:hypothetical protein
MSRQDTSGQNEEWSLPEDQLLLKIILTMKGTGYKAGDPRIWQQITNQMNENARSTNISNRIYTKTDLYSRWSSQIKLHMQTNS